MSAPKWTPGPWQIEQGGGHEPNSIRGSESIHVNGRPRNSLGVSSASYSERVCQNLGDLALPGPAANAHLIAAAPELYAGLEKAFNAIRAIDVDALGVVPETHDCPAFPIRDQLLHELARVMRKARGEQR